MKKIAISQLLPGMVTAESVLDINKQLIIEKGTLLKESHIRRLQSYNILAVCVEDSPITADLEEFEESNTEEAEDMTYGQKVRASEEYKAFRKNYDLKLDSLKTTLNSVVEKNVDLDVRKLLQSSLSMVSGTNSSMSVLDMLHNMREYDDSTYAHCMNVALICNVLATWLKLSPEDVEMATACGLLHDIGKIMVDQSLITKPGKLSATEYSEVKNHTVRGYKLLQEKNVDVHIRNAALMHHERNDGTGYPLGLRGEQIDRFARIVAIADVYDAMTATRVYREALCPFRVIEMFEEEGFQKYEVEYLLVFLENVVNTYIQNQCLLSDGTIATIVFVNRSKLSRPVVECEGRYINLADQPGLKIEKLL